MAELPRILTDTDGARLTDTDGALLTIPGDTREPAPPPAPTGVRYRGGTLYWSPAPGASGYRIYNARSAREVRSLFVALDGRYTPTQVGQVGDDEIASWTVAAYDEYVDMASARSRPAFSAGKNKQ